MDELTKIKGIGNATAAKLAAGGVDTFAKLAASNHEQLELLKIPGDAEDHGKFIAAAAELVPKTIDLNNATAEEVAAQAAKIETARLQLAQLADAVVLAHGHLQGLPADAAPELVADAQTSLHNARSLITAATKEACALLGVPLGAPLPAALLEELAPLAELPAIERPAVAKTAPPAAAEAQASAAPEVADAEERDRDIFADVPALEQDQAHAFLADVVDHARAAAASGEVPEAIAYLQQHRSELLVGQALLGELLEGINSEISALEEIQTTAPVERPVEVTATVDSRWRSGRQFTKAPTRFEAGELGSDELEALRGDPLLIVELL
ncbi:helix-hairpin-helix domain-containing protein [Devosia sediminis]|uniref:Helix-hairpin-helix domain-containing protein n=1 Tax=Devosia sediminis TaxID=2798801 RepID=A0A934IWB7_9HYPH|nr:helix-hairpin-helix domain-containing protein [Devosia sediminis]MBJ3783410.1 helix-hairpin-helix domain-containing protein [Devosia sediminis]